MFFSTLSLVATVFCMRFLIAFCILRIVIELLLAFVTNRITVLLFSLRLLYENVTNSIFISNSLKQIEEEASSAGW